MRIISPFKDYYDSAQAYGIDPKLVYVRETKVVPLYDPKTGKVTQLPKQLDEFFKRIPHMLLENRSHWKKYRRPAEFRVGMIAFCGTLYPFVHTDSECCYDIDHLKARMKAEGFLKEEIEKLEGPKHEMGRWWRRRSPPDWMGERLHRQSWAGLLASNRALDDEVHRGYHAPVLMVHCQQLNWPELIINPRLNIYDFQSQVDPATAWQRLSMYVGNNLVTQMDPNPPISDVLKAESAGFDKWSFRKHRDDPK